MYFIKFGHKVLFDIYKMKCFGFCHLSTGFVIQGCEFESHHRHPHCKFLYWYQEYLCPVEEPLYFSDEKSTTVKK